MLVVLTQSNLLLACQRDDCLLVNATNLRNNRSVDIPSTKGRLIISLQEDNEVLPTSQSANGTTFFVGKADFPNGGNSFAASISKLTLSLVGDPTLSIVAYQEENDVFRGRRFFASFVRNSFAYYLFSVQQGTGKPVRVAVARICTNDTGTGSPDNQFTTYTEIELWCRDNGMMEVTGTYFSGTFSDEQTDVRVLLAIHRASQPDTNFICSYFLSALDTQMDQTLTNCLDGNGRLGLARYGRIQVDDCPAGLSDQQKMTVTTCSRSGAFGRLLEVQNAYSGSVVASLTGAQPFHSLLVTNISGFLFIAAGSYGRIEQVG